MSQQVSYGTITIVDTNDIESIIVEYNRNQSTTSPPAQDDSGWSINRPAWAQGYYIWQRTRTHKSGTDTSEDEFGTAVCITGSAGQTGSAGRSLTDTKTQYTHVASNVVITTDNHTSYTWTDNVPSYSASAPAYWGRITNTYTNPSETEYIVYKDNGLTDAIAKSVEANANATAANTNATEALNKANNGIITTTQLWYQTNSSSKPAVPTAHSQVDNGTNTYNNWRTVRPTNNIDVYPYYYYCYEYKHGDNTYTYSAEAILDTSNLSQYQINALDTKLKVFFYPGDSNYPGAYAVANGSSDGLDITDISTYGYNVGIRPTNISIGYDSTPVIQLDGSTGKLNLYRFPTITGGTVTQAGTLGMSLGTSDLTFYKPDGVTESAVLNSNGLKISVGGLEAGTFNSSNYVYAWSTDRNDRALAINNSGSKTDWRFLAGKNFGVDKAGNLYALNAHVGGTLTAGSGSTIGPWNVTDTSIWYGNSTFGNANGIYLGTSGLSLGSAFKVTNTGEVTASNITATGGKIGGFELSSTQLNAYGDTEGAATSDTGIYRVLLQSNPGTNSGSNIAVGVSTRDSTSDTWTWKAYMTHKGSFVASDANITGTITAISGKIGGWNIGTDTNKSLYYGNQIPGATTTNLVLSPISATNTNAIAGSATGKTWFISAGQKFGVDTSGNLYATGATIEGKITVGTGSNVYTTDSVNPLYIGGRNLLKATPKTHDQAAYMAYALNLTENLVSGETYTLQLWGVTADANSEGIQPYWGGGSISLSPYAKPDANGYWCATFKVGSNTSTNAWICIYNRPNNHSGMSLSISKWKLEKGNKATDWTPTPEDVQADISAVDSKADGANSQEQRIYYRSNSTTAPTAPSTWVTSTSTANATWSTKRMQYDSTYKYLYTCIQRKTVGGTISNSTVLLDDTTTIIDGGNIITGTVNANQIASNAVTADKIAASSIGAKHLTVSDNTNLVMANEQFESSLPSINSPVISDGYLTKPTATYQYLFLTDFVNNSFNTGDELYYEFYAKAAVAGSVSLNVWLYNSSNVFQVGAGTGATIALTTTETKYSGTITLSHATWSTITGAKYRLGFSDSRDTKSQIYVRKVIIRRKSAGELIVDGSIITDKLAANAVTADKIAANAVTADKIAANAITVGDMADATKEAVLNSNLYAGNRNYLHVLDNGHNGVVSRTSTDVVYNFNYKTGVYTIRLNAVHDDQFNQIYENYIPSFSRVDSIAGKEVTVAVDDAYRSDSKTDWRIYVQFRDASNTYISGATLTSNTKSITMTVPTNAVYAQQILRMSLTRDGSVTTAAGTVFYIKGLRMTLGNAKVGWQLSPEDVYSDGNNILLGTELMDSSHFYTSNSANGTVTYGVSVDHKLTGAKKAIRLTSTSGSSATRVGFAQAKDKLSHALTRGPYTISCWVQTSVAGKVMIQPFFYTDQSIPNHNAVFDVTANAWYHLEYTVIHDDGGSDAVTHSGGYVYFGSDTANATCLVCGLKLEAGTTATVWSPADATKYITHIDNDGIRIHPSSTENNSAVINADGMEIFKDGTSVAMYGDEARVGNADAYHTKMTESSIELRKANNTMFDITASGATTTVTNTKQLLQTNTTTTGTSRSTSVILDPGVDYEFTMYSSPAREIQYSFTTSSASTTAISTTSSDNTRTMTATFVRQNKVVNGTTQIAHVKATITETRTSTSVAFPAIAYSYTTDIEESSIHFYGTNNVLWEGAWYMNASQTITLSESVSAQLSGIVLVWSSYNSSTEVADNFNWHYTFVPKAHVHTHGNTGVNCGVWTNGSALGIVASKYVYVSNTEITGYSANNTSGTGASGIKYDNSYFVLRYVLGV